MTEALRCRLCEAEIPVGRLKALPDTHICITCSREIGGEFALEVTISSTGKAGSLKKTGQDLRVRRVRKQLA